jgi:predicted glycosyltransferase
MNILIDLQHPAHLHFFRNLGHRLVAEGHRVLFTGRDKDILVELGNLYGVDIEVFGVARKGLVNLGRELIYRQARLVPIIRRFRPDVMMAIAGTFVSSLGKALRIPTYVFYDTEHALASNALAYPFATCIYVPRAYLGNIWFRHERYAGYHELAYLHPDHFTPDPQVLAEAGIEPGESFTVVRFVAWGAAHDIGKRRLTREEKMSAVERLREHSRVVISGEGGLPRELEPHRVRVAVHRIHHLMHYASLVFGESGTMPSEAAVMGVPSVYVNPLRLGYLEEQERDYGLVNCYRPERFQEAVERGVSILRDYDREYWRAKGRKLIADKIDVTDMLFRIATELPHWRGRGALFG